jgi:hypothetical protein
MGGFLYSWQKPLQEAIDESDLQKLAQELSAAETAIFVRMLELVGSPEAGKESEAIRQAGKEILKIQTKRLNWPFPSEMMSDCTE